VGFALARLGRREEAEKVITQLRDMSARASPDYEIARVYVALGEKERAFAALDRAHADLVPQMVWLKVDPLLEGLRGDPRFTTLLKRMQLE